MQDQDKTKEQLIVELEEMRRRVTELEEKLGHEAWRSVENSGLKLLEMLDMSHQAYFLLRDGRVEFLNRTCVEMFGYSHVEWSSLPSMFEKVIHPDDQEMVRKYYDNRTKHDTSHHRYVCRILCKDGSLKWLDIQSSSIMWKKQPAFLAVATDITEYIELQKSLEEKTHGLGERVKELNCLYQISKLIRNPGLSLPQIFKNVVDLIPPAWQYPEITCARILASGDVYTTTTTFRVVSRQQEEILVDGAPLGFVEVNYLEERPESDEGPFLKEERSLIKAIAEQMGEMISSRRSNEKLRVMDRAIETAIHGIGFANSDGRVSRVNQAFLRMWGFSSQDEVIGKHIAEFMEDPNAANELIELLKKGHFVVERTARKNDGSTFEAQLSTSSVLDDSGSLVCMMGSFMDITDQKRTQDLLEASEHRFRIGAQCASDDIYELDIPTNRVGHFGNIYQALGYPADETPTSATAWSELIHPDDRDRVMDSYTSCLTAEERCFEEEYRIRRKDGDFSYFIDRAFLLRDEHGAPYKWIGALTDITDRKMAEERLYLEKEKLKSILDHMIDGIYIVDSEYNVQYVNPALQSERGDVAGRKCHEYLAGLAEPCPWCKNQEVFAGESLSWERTSIKTGKTYEIFETPIRNEDGSTTKLLILHDITDRKAAEEELKQSEQRFRSFIESAPDAIFVQTKGCFAYVNKATQELFGADSPNSLLGTPVVEHFHSSDHEAVKQRILQSNVAKKLVPAREEKCLRQDGSIVLAEVSAVPIRYENEDGALVFARDLTERQRMNVALRQSEERFRQVSDNAEEWIWEVDDIGMYTYCSSSVGKILGYSDDELVGKKYFYDLYLPEEREKIKELAFEEFSKKSSFSGFVTVNMRKDGVAAILESSGIAIVDQNGNMIGYRGIAKDITERLRTEQEKARLFTAIEQAAASVIITSADGTIEYVNPAFEKITGYAVAEVIGKNPKLLQSGKHDKAFYEDLWNTISGGNVWNGRIINRRKDGSLVYGEGAISPVRDSHGKIVNYVQVTQDVTKELELQNQLVQAQKLEAIGTLAGGIAHDFNNILFAITGYTELAMLDLPPESRIRSNLERVMHAARRSGDMVKQILSFSRQGESETTALDLRPLVKEGLKFLRAAIPSTIEINQRIEPNLGNILGDPTQIHQVLMNLCVNASHAIKDNMGTISVELSEVELDADFTSENPPLAPGKHLRLTVTDTGAGIPSEIMEKIFDPYFTTKEAGKGTGLGLSVVHGIVTKHKGAITITSELGKGSTFSVFFPAIDKEEQPAELDSAINVTPTGKEHILVVDDEDHLLVMYDRQLRRLGYEVTCSSNPEEVLELFRTDPLKFDLVITDFTMPRMTGIELAKELGSIRPGLPIILCSGVSQVVSDTESKRAGIQTVIYKPIRRPEIAQAIRKALDKKL